MLHLRRLLALLALTCAAAAPAQSLSTDPRVASALELARIWIDAERAYERIAGMSVEIVHDEEVLLGAGFGQADIASGRPATADTIYSICSLSKLFTSIAVMPQRGAGRLRLDDPVGRHLPWFRVDNPPGEGEVTIERLLTHASGLPLQPPFPCWSAPDFHFPTHEDLVGKLGRQPPCILRCASSNTRTSASRWPGRSSPPRPARRTPNG